MVCGSFQCDRSYSLLQLQSRLLELWNWGCLEKKNKKMYFLHHLMQNYNSIKYTKILCTILNKIIIANTHWTLKYSIVNKHLIIFLKYTFTLPFWFINLLKNSIQNPFFMHKEAFQLSKKKYIHGIWNQEIKFSCPEISLNESPCDGEIPPTGLRLLIVTEIFAIIYNVLESF